MDIGYMVILALLILFATTALILFVRSRRAPAPKGAHGEGGASTQSATQGKGLPVEKKKH